MTPRHLNGTRLRHHMHREDLMLSQGRSPRLLNVMRVGVILLGVAVSSGASCFKPTGTKARVGSISGFVKSSVDSSGIAGVTVTAQSDTSSENSVATTDASGNYTVTGVIDGPGSVGLSTLPSNCTAPGSIHYGMASGAKLTATFVALCTP
jgi:hypothetical protein